MSTWSAPASYNDPLPHTMKYCQSCQKQTPHQIRSRTEIAASICISCLRRALLYEADRD